MDAHSSQPKLDYDYNPRTDTADVLLAEIVNYTNRIAVQYQLTIFDLNMLQTCMANEIFEGLTTTQKQLIAFFGTPLWGKVALHKIQVFKNTTIADLPDILGAWMKDYSRIVHGWLVRYSRVDIGSWVLKNNSFMVYHKSNNETEAQAMELDTLPAPEQQQLDNYDGIAPGPPLKKARTRLDSDAHLWRAINKLADQVALLQTKKGGA